MALSLANLCQQSLEKTQADLCINRLANHDEASSYYYNDVTLALLCFKGNSMVFSSVSRLTEMKTSELCLTDPFWGNPRMTHVDRIIGNFIHGLWHQLETFGISSGRGILVHSNYVASCCCRKILHRCCKCRFRDGSDIIIKYFKQITHCDIMTPFSDLDLCQNGLGWWLFASIIKSSLEITYPDNNAHCSCFVVFSWNGYGPFFSGLPNWHLAWASQHWAKCLAFL